MGMPSLTGELQCMSTSCLASASPLVSGTQRAFLVFDEDVEGGPPPRLLPLIAGANILYPPRVGVPCPAPTTRGVTRRGHMNTRACRILSSATTSMTVIPTSTTSHRNTMASSGIATTTRRNSSNSSNIITTDDHTNLMTATNTSVTTATTTTTITATATTTTPACGAVGVADISSFSNFVSSPSLVDATDSPSVSTWKQIPTPLSSSLPGPSSSGFSSSFSRLPLRSSSSLAPSPLRRRKRTEAERLQMENDRRCAELRYIHQTLKPGTALTTRTGGRIAPPVPQSSRWYRQSEMADAEWAELICAGGMNEKKNIQNGELEATVVNRIYINKEEDDKRGKKRKDRLAGMAAGEIQPPSGSCRLAKRLMLSPGFVPNSFEREGSTGAVSPGATRGECEHCAWLYTRGCTGSPPLDALLRGGGGECLSEASSVSSDEEKGSNICIDELLFNDLFTGVYNHFSNSTCPSSISNSSSASAPPTLALASSDKTDRILPPSLFSSTESGSIERTFLDIPPAADDTGATGLGSSCSSNISTTSCSNSCVMRKEEINTDSTTSTCNASMSSDITAIPNNPEFCTTTSNSSSVLCASSLSCSTSVSSSSSHRSWASRYLLLQMLKEDWRHRAPSTDCAACDCAAPLFSPSLPSSYPSSSVPLPSIPPPCLTCALRVDTRPPAIVGALRARLPPGLRTLLCAAVEKTQAPVERVAEDIGVILLEDRKTEEGKEKDQMNQEEVEKTETEIADRIESKLAFDISKKVNEEFSNDNNSDVVQTSSEVLPSRESSPCSSRCSPLFLSGPNTSSSSATGSISAPPDLTSSSPTLSELVVAVSSLTPDDARIDALWRILRGGALRQRAAGRPGAVNKNTATETKSEVPATSLPDATLNSSSLVVASSASYVLSFSSPSSFSSDFSSLSPTCDSDLLLGLKRQWGELNVPIPAFMRDAARAPPPYSTRPSRQTLTAVNRWITAMVSRPKTPGRKPGASQTLSELLPPQPLPAHHPCCPYFTPSASPLLARPPTVVISPIPVPENLEAEDTPKCPHCVAARGDGTAGADELGADYALYVQSHKSTKKFRLCPKHRRLGKLLPGLTAIGKGGVRGEGMRNGGGGAPSPQTRRHPLSDTTGVAYTTSNDAKQIDTNLPVPLTCSSTTTTGESSSPGSPCPISEDTWSALAPSIRSLLPLPWSEFCSSSSFSSCTSPTSLRCSTYISSKPPFVQHWTQVPVCYPSACSILPELLTCDAHRQHTPPLFLSCWSLVPLCYCYGSSTKSSTTTTTNDNKEIINNVSRLPLLTKQMLSMLGRTIARSPPALTPTDFGMSGGMPILPPTPGTRRPGSSNWTYAVWWSFSRRPELRVIEPRLPPRLVLGVARAEFNALPPHVFLAYSSVVALYKSLMNPAICVGGSAVYSDIQYKLTVSKFLRTPYAGVCTPQLKATIDQMNDKMLAEYSTTSSSATSSSTTTAISTTAGTTPAAAAQTCSSDGRTAVLASSFSSLPCSSSSCSSSSSSCSSPSSLSPSSSRSPCIVPPYLPRYRLFIREMTRDALAQSYYDFHCVHQPVWATPITSRERIIREAHDLLTPLDAEGDLITLLKLSPFYTAVAKSELPQTPGITACGSCSNEVKSSVNNLSMENYMCVVNPPVAGTTAIPSTIIAAAASLPTTTSTTAISTIATPTTAISTIATPTTAICTTSISSTSVGEALAEEVAVEPAEAKDSTARTAAAGARRLHMSWSRRPCSVGDTKVSAVSNVVSAAERVAGEAKGSPIESGSSERLPTVSLSVSSSSLATSSSSSAESVPMPSSARSALAAINCFACCMNLSFPSVGRARAPRVCAGTSPDCLARSTRNLLELSLWPRWRVVRSGSRWQRVKGFGGTGRKLCKPVDPAVASLVDAYCPVVRYVWQRLSLEHLSAMTHSTRMMRLRFCSRPHLLYGQRVPFHHYLQSNRRRPTTTPNVTPGSDMESGAATALELSCSNASRAVLASVFAHPGLFRLLLSRAGLRRRVLRQHLARYLEHGGGEARPRSGAGVVEANRLTEKRSVEISRSTPRSYQDDAPTQQHPDAAQVEPLKGDSVKSTCATSTMEVNVKATRNGVKGIYGDRLRRGVRSKRDQHFAKSTTTSSTNDDADKSAKTATSYSSSTYIITSTTTSSSTSTVISSTTAAVGNCDEVRSGPVSAPPSPPVRVLRVVLKNRDAKVGDVSTVVHNELVFAAPALHLFFPPTSPEFRLPPILQAYRVSNGTAAALYPTCGSCPMPGFEGAEFCRFFPSFSRAFRLPRFVCNTIDRARVARVGALALPAMRGACSPASAVSWPLTNTKRGKVGELHPAVGVLKDGEDVAKAKGPPRLPGDVEQGLLRPPRTKRAATNHYAPYIEAVVAHRRKRARWAQQRLAATAAASGPNSAPSLRPLPLPRPSSSPRTPLRTDVTPTLSGIIEVEEFRKDDADAVWNRQFSESSELPVRLCIGMPVQYAWGVTGCHNAWWDGTITDVKARSIRITFTFKKANKSVFACIRQFVPPNYPLAEPPTYTWRLRPARVERLWVGAVVCCRMEGNEHEMFDAVVQKIWVEQQEEEAEDESQVEEEIKKLDLEKEKEGGGETKGKMEIKDEGGGNSWNSLVTIRPTRGPTQRILRENLSRRRCRQWRYSSTDRNDAGENLDVPGGRTDENAGSTAKSEGCIEAANSDGEEKKKKCMDSVALEDDVERSVLIPNEALSWSPMLSSAPPVVARLPLPAAVHPSQPPTVEPATTRLANPCRSSLQFCAHSTRPRPPADSSVTEGSAQTVGTSSSTGQRRQEGEPLAKKELVSCEEERGVYNVHCSGGVVKVQLYYFADGCVDEYIDVDVVRYHLPYDLHQPLIRSERKPLNTTTPSTCRPVNDNNSVSKTTSTNKPQTDGWYWAVPSLLPSSLSDATASGPIFRRPTRPLRVESRQTLSPSRVLPLNVPTATNAAAAGVAKSGVATMSSGILSTCMVTSSLPFSTTTATTTTTTTAMTLSSSFSSCVPCLDRSHSSPSGLPSTLGRASASKCTSNVVAEAAGRGAPLQLTGMGCMFYIPFHLLDEPATHHSISHHPSLLTLLQPRLHLPLFSRGYWSFYDAKAVVAAASSVEHSAEGFGGRTLITCAHPWEGVHTGDLDNDVVLNM